MVLFVDVFYPSISTSRPIGPSNISFYALKDGNALRILEFSLV